MQSNRAAGRRRSGGSGGAPYRSRRRGIAPFADSGSSVLLDPRDFSPVDGRPMARPSGLAGGERDAERRSAMDSARDVRELGWRTARSGSDAGEHAARRGCLAHAHPEQSLPAHNQPIDPGRRDAQAAAGVPSSPPACRNDPREGSCAPNLTDLLRVPAPHHHRGDADRPERDVRPGRGLDDSIAIGAD